MKREWFDEHRGPLGHLMGPWMAMAGGPGPRGPHGPWFREGARGGFPFGGPGGPPFRRRPKAGRGDVRNAVLLLLDEEPRNGYQLMQEIEARSEGVWRPSPGSVYPTLTQLEDEGLVRAATRGGGKVFELTEEGRTHVAGWRDRVPPPWATMSEDVTDEMVELRDLVGQLGAAVKQVVHAGTQAQIAEAGKVLGAARRALYRILAEDDPDEDASL